MHYFLDVCLASSLPFDKSVELVLDCLKFVNHQVLVCFDIAQFVVVTLVSFGHLPRFCLKLFYLSQRFDQYPLVVLKLLDSFLEMLFVLLHG